MEHTSLELVLLQKKSNKGWFKLKACLPRQSAFIQVSSIRRPSADFVVQQFKEMEKEGLGVLRNAHRSTIFFKKLPEFLIHEEYKLGKHNITVDDYRKLLAEVDEFYDERQSAEVMKLYPWKDDALRYPLPADSFSK